MSLPLARRLAHDVAKYIERTARNLEERPLDPALARMLAADLYATDGQRSALEVFDSLVEGVNGPLCTELLACRQALAQIEALRQGVEAGLAAEVLRAAELALEVAALVRHHVQKLEHEEA